MGFDHDISGIKFGSNPQEFVSRLPEAELFNPGAKGLVSFSDPNPLAMSQAVMSMGPVGFGADHRTWKWDGCRWVPDDEVIDRRLAVLAGNHFRKHHVASVRTMCSATRVYDIDPGTPDKSVIGFSNGVYDLEKKTLLPHDPARGFVPVLSVAYNKDATCPRFIKWVTEVVAPEDVALAWEIIAYMLLTGNPQQIAMMLIGAGGNGKGTFLRVLRHILGKANYTSQSLAQLTGNRFRMAQLYGKTANICGDIDPTHLKETAAFKLATGEDLVSAEHKGLPPFDFEAYAVPIFSANEVPTTSDTSDGYFRRWIPLEFPNSFQAGGFNEEALFEELEGIVAMALAMLPFVLTDKLRPNPVTMEKFETASDPFRSFYSERCTPGPDLYTSRDDIYGAYKHWTEQNGHMAMSARKVYAKLRELKIRETTRDTGQRGFCLHVEHIITRQL